MTDPVRWGVLGATSSIFRSGVLPGFRSSDQATLLATASRSGADHDSDAERRYGDYDELLADPDVEAVYLPLPNAHHERWTVAAAKAGKHVLCEKPLGPDADAARRMAAACAGANVLLAEAYMTPFHPRSVQWDTMVADGWVGTPLHGTARFSFPPPDPDDHRWWTDGGGALLDVGIYCLEPLLTAGGWGPGDPPPQLAVNASLTDRGVDATFTGWLDLPSGFTGAFCCSFDAPDGQTLEVVGTGGSLRVEPAFTPARDDTAILATPRDGLPQTIHSPPGAMYQLMVEHVGRVVRAGVPPQRPLEASIALADLIDLLRASVGRTT